MTTRHRDTAPTLDEWFGAVADRHRRRVLVALLEAEDVTLQIPYDVIGADDDVEGVHLKLVHAHLPKLRDSGAIEWDESTDEVRRGPRFEAVRPLVELLDENAADLPGEWT